MFDGLIKKKLWKFGWKIMAGLIFLVGIGLLGLYLLTH